MFNGLLRAANRVKKDVMIKYFLLFTAFVLAISASAQGQTFVFTAIPDQDESRSEKTRRLLLGCFWISLTIAWWLSSVIPVIYVIASAP